MKDHLTLGGGHTPQYKDHVSQKCTLEPIQSYNQCHPNQTTTTTKVMHYCAIRQMPHRGRLYWKALLLASLHV